MTSYNRLGDYIETVDVRNKDGRVEELVGLTIDKAFIPSVANTHGTDLSKYKVIKRNQFACSLMQVSRDGKMPVAMFNGDAAIMSPAYPIFKISSDKLLPKYLMMWFSREEFDEEASFHAVGGVRGNLTWEDFCDLRLPVPSIEEQNRIVAEYEAIENRIAVNKRMIEKLEQTATALYRHNLVDGIDSDNLPDGWKAEPLSSIADYLNGAACQKYESNADNAISVLKIKELNQGFVDSNSNKVSIDIPTKYIVNNDDVIFSWSATLIVDIWEGGKCALNQHLFKVSSDKYPKWLYFLATKSHIDEWTRFIEAKATSMSHIKREDLDNAIVNIPPQKLLDKLDSQINPLIALYSQKKRENLELTRLISLLQTSLSNKI